MMVNLKISIRIKRICTALTCAIILASMIATSQPLPSVNSYIVLGKDLHTVQNFIEDVGGSVTHSFSAIQGVSAELSPGQVLRLLRMEGIKSVTPNTSVTLANNAGNKHIPATDYPDVVGADLVWNQGVSGSGVTVAVVDTGIARHQGVMNAPTSPSQKRLIGWVDFVDGSPVPVDPHGHGTHIAGIVANSQVGSDGEWNGVAPAVDLVGVRVLNEQGFGTYEQVIQGIQWVIDNRDTYNIRVMNLSLVSPALSPYFADPINLAAMRAWAEGIIVIAAAGNGGPKPMTVGVPANNPYIVTVGAFTDNFTPLDWGDDYLTPFSAAGPTLDGFVKPDLVAPGARMVSSVLPSSWISKENPGNNPSAQYFSMSGTSQAAAVVSGVAALILAHNPDLSPDQVKYRLMYTAFPWIDLETTNALYSVWQQGAGRINAPDAVFASIEGTANQGMDIFADLAGEVHYEGFSYFDEESGEFRLRGDFSDWTGGYGNWAGGYGNWAGGYGNWAGGYGNWAGGYGNWAGGYGNWAGGYGNWTGGYGNWAGGYGNWAGGYGNWAGGYGNWAGGYGNWAGSYGDPLFAEDYLQGSSGPFIWEQLTPGTGTWVDFDG
jgi:serine protease AprX